VWELWALHHTWLSQDCADTLARIFSKLVGDNSGLKLHLHHENCHFFILQTLGINSS
jgi:hypothetical protein